MIVNYSIMRGITFNALYNRPVSNVPSFFQVFYSDDNTATLVVKEVFPEDAGMFTCVAKNQAGYSTSSAELVVEGPISDHGSETMLTSRRSLSRESSVCDIMEGIPPTFANKPCVKTVEEGAQLEMDVRLVAIPEPDIVWKKDGQVSYFSLSYKQYFMPLT